MKQLADFLEQNCEEILRHFEERLRAGHSPEQPTPSELRNHLPAYVRLLAQTLRTRAERPAGVTAARQAAAEQHGAQRLELGFDAGSLVREYGYLHDCILDLAKQVGFEAGEPARRELLDQINLTCSQAVGQYVRQLQVLLMEQTAHHVSFLAHELRDPLGSARLAMDLLSLQYDAGKAPAGQMLLRSLARLRDLIDGALSRGLLDGGSALHRTRISLRDLLTDVVAESEVTAQARGLRLALEPAEDICVEGDPRLLRSAVSNLVRNAIKFSREGGVTVRAARTQVRARVEVEDTCGGLPEGTEHTLFQPFVQVGADRSGFGLGLAITQRAIKAHGGEVFVRNCPGRGCCIGFEVPLTAADQGPF